MVDRLSGGRSGLLQPVSDRAGKRMVFGSAKLLLAVMLPPLLLGLGLLLYRLF